MKYNIYKRCIIGFLALIWVNSLVAEVSDAWIMQDTTGKIHQLTQYKGKWLVVNYWAPWCPPCLEEMPELVAFYDEHRLKNVMVLGVAVQYENEKSVREFAEDMLVSFPIILGNAQKKPLPQPEVLPTTYIYHPDGRLYKVKRGAVSKHWLEQLLTEASADAKSIKTR